MYLFLYDTKSVFACCAACSVHHITVARCRTTGTSCSYAVCTATSLINNKWRNIQIISNGTHPQFSWHKFKANLVRFFLAFFSFSFLSAMNFSLDVFVCFLRFGWWYNIFCSLSDLFETRFQCSLFSQFFFPLLCQLSSKDSLQTDIQCIYSVTLIISRTKRAFEMKWKFFLLFQKCSLLDIQKQTNSTQYIQCNCFGHVHSLSFLFFDLNYIEWYNSGEKLIK